MQEAVVSSGMTAIVAAMDTVIQLMEKVFTLMTSNPLLTVFVAASLIPVGVRIFKSVRNAARG